MYNSIVTRGYGGGSIVTCGIGGVYSGQVEPIPEELPALTYPSNAIFLWDNKLDLATLSTTSELITKPTNNLKKQLRSRTWRTADIDDITETDGSGRKYVELLVQLDFPYLVSVISMIDHNLTDDVIITVQANSSNSWSSPPYSKQFYAGESVFGYGEGEYGAGGFGGYFTRVYRKKQPPAIYFSELDRYKERPVYQWWKITITIPTDTQMQYIDISRIFMGDYLETSKNYLYGVKQYVVDSSTIDTSDGGVDNADRKDLYSMVDFTINKMADSELFAQFMTFYYNVGITDNFILAMDPTSPVGRFYKNFYGRFTNKFGGTLDFNNQSTIEFNFKEAL